MVIRAAYQDSRLLHPDLLHQLEIFLAGTDPACDLRELVSPLHTFVYGVTILLAVQEKLTGTDHSIRSAQLMQVIKDRHDLLCRVWRTGLLSIPEGSICDPDILGHIVRHDPVVKRDLGDLRVRKHIPKYIRLFDVIQNVHVLFDFQKVVLFIHSNRTVQKRSLIIVHHFHDLSLLLVSLPDLSIRLITYNCIQSYHPCQPILSNLPTSIIPQPCFRQSSPRSRAQNTMRRLTSSFPSSPSFCKSRAAAPETIGVAMEVPLFFI